MLKTEVQNREQHFKRYNILNIMVIFEFDKYILN